MKRSFVNYIYVYIEYLKSDVNSRCVCFAQRLGKSLLASLIKKEAKLKKKKRELGALWHNRWVFYCIFFSYANMLMITTEKSRGCENKLLSVKSFAVVWNTKKSVFVFVYMYNTPMCVYFGMCTPKPRHHLYSIYFTISLIIGNTLCIQFSLLPT